MKSEYFRQIELDTFPKKTLLDQAKRKLIADTAVHNALTHSRDYRSEKRTMVNSIDPMRKSKQENGHRMKASYSKHTFPLETEGQRHEPQWVELKCMECEGLRVEQGKRLKHLQMLYEEELTEQKERYILMEKKYLLKDSDCLRLQAEYEGLQHCFLQMEADYNSLRSNYELLEGNLKNAQMEQGKLMEQNKNQGEKIDNLHHFLKLYVEQTKVIINWAHLFEQIQDELPTLMHVIKEDLLIRKMDFQITLREAAAFEKLNFSEIASNKEEASGFLGDDSGCETFMKYLKQETKLRSFSNQTSTKKGQSFMDSFSNKENIDFLNGISIKSLLNSSAKEKKSKQKPQIMNDDCLRLLLIQAKTIESSIDSRGSSIKERGQSIRERGSSIKESRMVPDFPEDKFIFA